MAGTVVGTNYGVVRIEDEKLPKGVTLRQEIFRLRPDSTLAARSLLSSAASINFNQWVAAGCGMWSRHLRHGRTAVNDSGIMELRRSGDGRADT